MKSSSLLFLETEENPKFLPYSPYTPTGGQMDKIPRKTNMVSGGDEYQTEGKYEFNVIFLYFITEMVVVFVLRNW
jgi:hypothetical protein